MAALALGVLSPSAFRRLADEHPPMSDGQRQALQRLADYPARVERLKQLWIDVNRGSQPSRLARAGASAVFNRSGSMPGRSDHCSRMVRRGCGGGRGGFAGNPGIDQARLASLMFEGLPLTVRQISDLMTRDLTPEDYELLLLLDEGVIKKVPTLAPGCASRLPRPETPAAGWQTQACSVCLCTVEEGDDVRALPSCGHVFHAACIEQWLVSSKANCPLCGREVAPPRTPPLAAGQGMRGNHATLSGALAGDWRAHACSPLAPSLAEAAAAVGA